jgi:uncharacterized protein
MAVVDLTAVYVGSRGKNLFLWRVSLLNAAVIALALAFLLGIHDKINHFDMVRLAAYGVFLHGTVLMGLSAAMFYMKRRFAASICCVVAALGILAVAFDAFLIEPHSLVVSRVRISSPKITRPIKIVLAADVQTDRIGNYEKSVFQRIIEEKPDLLLLGGDYLQPDPDATDEEIAKFKAEFLDVLRDVLNRGLAPGGRIFAIQGNLEWRDWPACFAGLSDERFNAAELKRSFDLDPLQLTCISVSDSFNASLNIEPARKDRFHIVLGHSPNFALGQINADLLLAGHTHGGQVCLPFLGPIVTNSDVSRAWASGLSDLPSGAKLLVSRGVGMERGYAPRLRFLCRPELVVIELAPEDNSTAGEGHASK